MRLVWIAMALATASAQQQPAPAPGAVEERAALQESLGEVGSSQIDFIRALEKHRSEERRVGKECA